MKRSTSRPCTRKDPSASRSFGWAMLALGAACAALPAGVHAQPRLVTEADVLAAVRARHPDVLGARAAVAASRAREGADAADPNPSLSWDREHMPGSGALAEREDVLAVSLPIELGGSRSARRALAESVTAQAHAEHARATLSAAHAALALFYEAIAAREHIAIGTAQLARLAEAERVLSRRVAEGSAPGYDLVRLQLEAELAHSELKEREAEAAAALAELAALLDLPSGGIELSGDLDLRERVERPALDEARAHLERGRGAAARAEDAAGSAWLPALELRGGAKLTSAEGDHAVGYVAGASLELPLFDQKRALSEEAAARRAELEAQRDARERAIDRLERRAEKSLEAARAEQLRFELATRERVTELERAADTAYREGRQTIVELLDAQRMRTAIEDRKLALKLAAKRAELDMRAARNQLGGAP